MSGHKGGLIASVRRILAMGNHDFCPWANRYVYWLKQPIGWFVLGAIAAAMTAMFVEPKAWLIVGSLIAVMLLGVAWPWVAMRGATATISFDRPRCREGDQIQVRLSIHNRWPLPLWGLAVENGFFVEANETGSRPVVSLFRVSAWSQSEFLFEFRPESRGVYPHIEPELATGFPFGIWRAARKIPVERSLLAWPRTAQLTSIPSLGGDIAEVIGMLFDRPGNEGDVIGVRPFRHGDRLRSIHWAQTARQQSLIVTERQAPARRLVVVAVDVEAFTSKGQPSESSHRQLETAIRVAASIAREFHAHHAEVRFVIGEVDLLLSPDTAGLHRMLDALARFKVDPRSSRQPNSFGLKALSVVLTTSERQADWELSAVAMSMLKLVLVDAVGSAGNNVQASHTNRRNAWITIDSDSFEPQQFRHQWERVCHDSLAK